MTNTNLIQEAEDIYEQLHSTADVQQSDIEEKLETLVDQYQVPLREARRSVINDLSDDTDGDPSDFDSNQAADVGSNQ